MAIFGLSFGAKAIKTEWSFPNGFSAVPVFPHTIILSSAAILAVTPAPPFTAASSPRIICSKFAESILILCFSVNLGSILLSAPIDFTI